TYEVSYAPKELPANEHMSSTDQQIVSWYDLLLLSETCRSKKPVTDVVSTEVLDYLPDEDVPWVLDELFRSARRKIAVTVTTATGASVLGLGIHGSHRPPPDPWRVA